VLVLRRSLTGMNGHSTDNLAVLCLHHYGLPQLQVQPPCVKLKYLPAGPKLDPDDTAHCGDLSTRDAPCDRALHAYVNAPLQ